MAEGVGFEPTTPNLQEAEDQGGYKLPERQSSLISSPGAGNFCPILAEIASIWPELSEPDKNVLKRVAESLREGGES